MEPKLTLTRKLKPGALKLAFIATIGKNRLLLSAETGIPIPNSTPDLANGITFKLIAAKLKYKIVPRKYGASDAIRAYAYAWRKGRILLKSKSKSKSKPNVKSN